MKRIGNRSGFTILELLIVLGIIGTLLSLIVYGVARFRQNIVVSNAAKEVLLQIRKARRYAINNTITSRGTTPSGYYVFLNGDTEFFWGECDTSGCVDSSDSIKSEEFGDVGISTCDNTYGVIKFNAVTGEFFITNDRTAESTDADSCKITVSVPGGISREIIIDSNERLIKIETD